MQIYIFSNDLILMLLFQKTLTFFYPLFFLWESGQQILTKESEAVQVSKGGLCGHDFR